MAEKKASTAAVESAAKVKKYPLENLAANCVTLYGVSSCAFAGATAGLDADTKYTVEEMKKILDDWLKKGVK